MPFIYFAAIGQLYTRLTRYSWSKTPVTERRQGVTKTKPTKSTNPCSNFELSSSSARSSARNTTVHDVSAADCSWFSRRKLSLQRQSVSKMAFVEEVRLPCPPHPASRRHEYIPIDLGIVSSRQSADIVIDSDGAVIELDDVNASDRRSSTPRSPVKPMPVPALPKQNSTRLSVEQHPLQTVTVQHESIPNTDRSSSEPLIFDFAYAPSYGKARRPKPPPLNFHKSAKGKSKQRPKSASFTAVDIAHSGYLFDGEPSPRTDDALFSRSRPQQAQRPKASQSGCCGISDSPLIDLFAGQAPGSYPDTPSTTGSRTTAARWWAVTRRR